MKENSKETRFGFTYSRRNLYLRSWKDDYDKLGDAEDILKDYPSTKGIFISCDSRGPNGIFELVLSSNLKIKRLSVSSSKILKSDFECIARMPLLKRIDIDVDHFNRQKVLEFEHFFHPTITILDIKSTKHTDGLIEAVSRIVSFGVLRQLVLALFLTEDEAELLGQSIYSSSKLEALELMFSSGLHEDEIKSGLKSKTCGTVIDYAIKRGKPIKFATDAWVLPVLTKLIKSEMVLELELCNSPYQFVEREWKEFSRVVLNSKSLQGYCGFRSQIPLAFVLPNNFNPADPKSSKVPRTISKIESLDFDTVNVSLKVLSEAYPNLEYVEIKNFIAYEADKDDMTDIFAGLDARCKLQLIEIDKFHLLGWTPEPSEDDDYLQKRIEQSYRNAVRRGYTPCRGIAIQFQVHDDVNEEGETSYLSVGDRFFLEGSSDCDFDDWNVDNGFYMPYPYDEGIPKSSPNARRNLRMHQRARDAATIFMAMSRKPEMSKFRDISKMISQFLYETRGQIEAWSFPTDIESSSDETSEESSA